MFTLFYVSVISKNGKVRTPTKRKIRLTKKQGLTGYVRISETMYTVYNAKPAKVLGCVVFMLVFLVANQSRTIEHHDLLIVLELRVWATIVMFFLQKGRCRQTEGEVERDSTWLQLSCRHCVTNSFTGHMLFPI